MRIGNPGCLLAVALVAVAPPAAAHDRRSLCKWPVGISVRRERSFGLEPRGAAHECRGSGAADSRHADTFGSSRLRRAVVYGAAQQNADGLAGPSFGPSAPIYGPGTTAIGSGIRPPAPAAQVTHRRRRSFPRRPRLPQPHRRPQPGTRGLNTFTGTKRSPARISSTRAERCSRWATSGEFGIERIRAEMFGGEVHYDGYGQFDGNGINETLPSHTSYLGLRGEYESIWEPAAWQGRIAFLGGLGSRFWFRDLHDGTTPDGNPDLRLRRDLVDFLSLPGRGDALSFAANLDLYSESRVCATVLTYDYATIGDRPVWPKPGVMANVEIGLRYTHFFAALRGEVMRWEDSSVVQAPTSPARRCTPRAAASGSRSKASRRRTAIRFRRFQSRVDRLRYACPCREHYQFGRRRRKAVRVLVFPPSRSDLP